MLALFVAMGKTLYRYQLRLRLARALDLLARYDDSTSLALDLGFSSHNTSAVNSGSSMESQLASAM